MRMIFSNTKSSCGRVGFIFWRDHIFVWHYMYMIECLGDFHGVEGCRLAIVSYVLEDLDEDTEKRWKNSSI